MSLPAEAIFQISTINKDFGVHVDIPEADKWSVHTDYYGIIILGRMTRTLILLVTILLFHASLPSSSSSSSVCNKHDKKVLLDFKNSFRPDPLKSWSNSTDCCTWDHVGCDTATGRVTSLHFSNEYDLPPSILLNGSIPAPIGDLSALESITFYRLYTLEGHIPPQLAKLKNLKYLTIYLTRVSGPVPSFLSQLPSLRRLSLASNRLSGTIPPSLGNLVHLVDLVLYGNKIMGLIPTALFTKLKSLATLDLSKNRLTGPIPRSLANSSVAFVFLDNNKLTGDASFLFGKSKPIMQINLSWNRLAFDLSKVQYPLKLGFADMSHNKIYGSISDQITELPSLNYFDVSYNKLCGKIPSGGNFSTFSADSYAHNKCLCGEPLQPCK